MTHVLILIFLISALVGLRTLVQRYIQAAVLLVGGDNFHGIMVYSFIFLPGVMIHEMAHFFTAAILGVRTGDITFFPRRGTVEEGRIALGTVKVARTDFVRSSLIGAAPFIIGTFVLWVLVTVVTQPVANGIGQQTYMELWELVKTLFTNPRNWLMLYLVFAIANTMFVSREDARAFPVIIVFFLLFVGVLVLTGNMSRVVNFIWPKIQNSVVLLTGSFFAAMIIDIVVVVVLFLFVQVIQKFVRKRVVYGR